MAYLALDHRDPCDSVSVAAQAQPVFTALEERVIAIGMDDPMSALRTPGKLTRINDIVFGLRPHNRLADPRLEALRGYVIKVRLRADLSQGDRQTILESGFTKKQIDALDLILDKMPANSDRSDRSPSVLDQIGDLAAKFWFNSTLSESFVAALISAYFGVPFAVSPKPWR